VIDRADRATAVALPETLAVAVAAATDVGGRPSNEDAVLAEPLPWAAGEAPAFLLAVADGMGGHADGEVASALAIEALRGAFAGDGGAGADPALTLKQAFRRANEAIWAHGDGGDGGRPGTTLTAAVLKGKYATIASVGDSRAYLLRGRGLTQVTKDHTIVAEQVAKGALSAAEARAHPNRNVLTQALGAKPKLDTRLPPVYELSLLPGDRLLLCSDGFFEVLEDRDYADALAAGPAAEAAAALVALATERGTTDNVSAVVAEAVPTRVPTALPTSVERGGFPVAVAVAVAAILLIALVAAVLILGGFVG
jgi:protein phosphatase